MASNELLQGLIEATLAGSAAAVLVLALRRPMRAAFGAQVAYALWLLPALAMLATLLPAATVVAARLPVAPALVLPAGAAMAAAPVPHDIDIAAGLLVLWVVGALVGAGWLWRAQVAFRRGLGALLPHGDALRAQAASAGLPATLGLWRPRIVLPADFEERFDPAQRALVLAHERRHVARLDPWANAAAALLRCLFWFNPLFHLAAARMRHDQELACDADVLAANPRQRRRYGDALLNVQLALQSAPLGCHFGFGHPLKERIMLLNRERPTSRMRRAGVALLALAAGATAWSAWATQPPRTQVAAAAGDFTVEVEYSRDAGTPIRSVLAKRFGESFALPGGAGGNDKAITAACSRFACRADWATTSRCRSNRGVSRSRHRGWWCAMASRPACVRGRRWPGVSAAWTCACGLLRVIRSLRCRAHGHCRRHRRPPRRPRLPHLRPRRGWPCRRRPPHQRPPRRLTRRLQPCNPAAWIRRRGRCIRRAIRHRHCRRAGPA